MAGLVAAISASPLQIRQSTITDVDILNYALTLEHLENRFYATGLSNFSLSDFQAAGFDATFYNNIVETSLDESTHVTFLSSALSAAGASPVQECTYSFPVTDVASFVAVASVLEGVGVSAYAGAAFGISSATYLTAAATVLSVEARHTAYIRSRLSRLPYPQPFDAPLTFNQVYSLASQFIVSCPSTNKLPPLTAYPILTPAQTSAPIIAGSTISILTNGYTIQPVDGTSQLYAAFITVTGPIFTPVSVNRGGYSVTIPTGINGQSYLVFTSCSSAVTDDTTLAIGIVEISNPKFA